MTTAQARGQQERPFTASQHRQYKRAQEIRDRQADGEPRAGRDLAFVLGLLKQHPRARPVKGGYPAADDAPPASCPAWPADNRSPASCSWLAPEELGATNAGEKRCRWNSM